MGLRLSRWSWDVLENDLWSLMCVLCRELFYLAALASLVLSHSFLKKESNFYTKI